MSKAEERALEAYPVFMGTYSDNCREYDMNESDRLTYQEGYERAVRDFREKIISGLQDIPEEIQKVIDNNFLEML